MYGCGLGVSTGRHLQPASSFYLLVGPGKQIREANACCLCEHSAWHGIKHERTWPGSWAETLLQTGSQA